jgi:hypothetical protein
MEPGVPFLLTIEFDGGGELLRLAARLQIVARKYGFKPVWLIGVEALRHPTALEPLARWQREGEAEVGALLDAEAVPPLVDIGPLTEGRRPVLTDYPESIMDEKLSWLTTAIEQTIGRKPVTLRAVRPSVDDRYYTLLAKHGYKIDLTVVPHAKIGPADFTGYSEKAYVTPQGIFEIPRTVRRRKYGPFVEDLLLLPGILGVVARRLFPTLRCFRLRKGNLRHLRTVAAEVVKGGPGHLDLRIGRRDWRRGDRLVRDLERVLAAVQTGAQGLGAEEFFQRYKNEQLRKGLV